MINLSKIVAAILVLLAIALGIYAWMLARKPAAPPPVAAAANAPPAQQSAPTFPAVFTTKAVKSGLPIPPDAIRIEQIAVSSSSVLTEVDKVTGRIPVFDMPPGTPVMENQLVSGLALRIEEGERGISIKTDETVGVGNKIRPGDFVDVFFTLKSDNKEIENGQARLLLARKRVLAYGNASVDGMPSAEGASHAQSPRNEVARTAVLAVSVDEINRLAVVENVGRLTLALRNPKDTAEPDPALLADLPALLTVAGKPGAKGRAPLNSIDKAAAGLTVTALATGVDKSASSKASTSPPIARASTPRPAATAAARPRLGTEVEVIKGDKREMLSY